LSELGIDDDQKKNNTFLAESDIIAEAEKERCIADGIQDSKQP
jgi:hypothetical protein